MGDHRLFRFALFTSVAAISTASPSVAHAQTRSFNVPAQSAATGVAELGRQADAQILISADDATGRQTRRVVGNYTTERALELLLRESGLRAQRSEAGTFVVVAITAHQSTAQDAEQEGVPDILVRGRRDWSLNTGIERTRDDSQPFAVFDQEYIKRSGSTNLEQFLRDFLNTNASETTAEQSAPRADKVQGISSINLRGLGDRETLILVDGRRQPGLSLGDGTFRQPLITNLPLASIERIEVLASSAAGIYGQGATGGVINIVLRRDYSGRQLTLNYADTTDFHNPDKRIDLVVGQSLENGRSNISLSATYRKADPLLRKYRADFLEGNLRHILGNNPEFFGTQIPTGSTPNIRTLNGQPLRLDPQYGGTLLSSNRTFVPEGYRGVAADGIALLLENLGQFNLDLPDSAAFGGGNQPLINGTDQLGGTLALRREMTSWLRVYGEVALSRYKSTNIESLAGGIRTIQANAPNNPFQNTIVVRAPITGADRERPSENRQLRLLGGAIVQLPYQWQAVADVSYSRARFIGARDFETLTSASSANLSNGTFNIIQDIALTSFPFEFDTLLAPNLDLESSVTTATLKLAGPVPVELPGGRPTLALNLERAEDKLSETFGVSGIEGGNTIQIRFVPARTQTIQSAYGEVRLPIIGDSNNVPLVQGLELVIAARYEHYKGDGTLTNNLCYSSSTGLPPGTTDITELCDGDALDLQRETASSSRLEPTFSAKWTVSPDITFRGSYATGYLPPRLNDLIPTPGNILISATDPERGDEQIGGSVIAFLPGVGGGNPDILPERSETISFGTILTPRFIPGLRFSADYTKIKKRDNYFNPSLFLFAFGTEEGQRAFEGFLSLFPERFTRGPASGGFAVGPITSIDVRTVNISGSNVEAIDFALDYGRPLWGGTIDLGASATHNLELSSQLFAGSSVIDVTGARPISAFGIPTVFPNVALDWKGVGSLRWSNDDISIGLRARYFDSFDLNYEGTLDANNNATSIRSQTYVDIFASYRFGGMFTLRGGLNNVFGERPPYIDRRYSEYGDPRFTNFYLNLTADF